MTRHQSFLVSAGFLIASLLIYYFGVRNYNISFIGCFTFGLMSEDPQCDWPGNYHFSFKLGLLLSAAFTLYGLRKSENRSN